MLLFSIIGSTYYKICTLIIKCGSSPKEQIIKKVKEIDKIMKVFQKYLTYRYVKEKIEYLI